MDSSSMPAQPVSTAVEPSASSTAASKPVAVETPAAAAKESDQTQVKRHNSSAASPPPSGRGGHGHGSQGFQGSGPSRQRQPPPPPNNCVVLKNLDYEMTAMELENVLREITGGRKSFVNVTLVEDKNTKSFRGMAFVNFPSVEDAQKWLPQLSQLRVNNRKVYAEFRRMKPGEKERREAAREAREQRTKSSFGGSQYKRSTFEDDIVAPAQDGKSGDVRASFFAARDNVRKAGKADQSSRVVEKQGREKELEDDFRAKLLEYRDAPVPDGEEIQDVVFDQDLTSFERRIVHVLCDELGLGHVARSVDGARLLFVTKDPERIAKWEVETADARKAAALKAAEKLAIQEEKKKKQREAQEKARPEATGKILEAGHVMRSKSAAAEEAAAYGVLLGGPATEEELKGINWTKFRPKSAMSAAEKDAAGDGTVGMLSKPSYKVYEPPRQPTGPDGTIGFKRRNPNGNVKGSEGVDSEPTVGETSKATQQNGDSGDGGSADTSADVKTSSDDPVGRSSRGIRQIKLNPTVPAFEFPGEL